MIVDTAHTTISHTANQCAPREGPKALSVPLDFAAAAQIDLDYSMLQPDRFEQLQGFYIDNSANASSVSITIPSTGQKMTMKAHRQGYRTCISQNPIRLQFNSAGGVMVGVWLLNFPVASFEWDTV
jgi:hypothetical protein